MSVRYRAAVASPLISTALPSARHLPPWLVAVAAVTLLLPILLVHASRAEPGPAHQILDAEAARRLGMELQATRQVMGRQLLVTIGSSRARSSASAAAPDQPYLLAAAPDGVRIATADRVGREAAQLMISQPDGGVSITALAGVLDGAFSPDGAWLAAIDGSGAAWRVAAASGEAALIADGPFAGEVEFAPDGRLLLLAVSAIDAPTSSMPVLVDPASGEIEVLDVGADESLIYRVRLTAEGLAIVAHVPDGTKKVRLIGPPVPLLAELPSNAGAADIGPDLASVAYRLAGERKVILARADGTTRAFEVEGRPVFAPDGTSLLVTAGLGAATIDLASGTVTTVTGQAVWAACSEECQP